MSQPSGYEPPVQQPQEIPPAAPASDPTSSPTAAPNTPPHSVERPRGLDERGRPRGGKVSALWIGLIVAAILLILLLIFIAQNSHDVPIHFFTASGHISLAVALLLSAVVAALLVAIPGSVRIYQLRRLVKRTARLNEQDRR